jgi:hypothetical protein
MDEMAMAPWPPTLDETIPVSCLSGYGHATVIVAALVERIGAR